MWYDKYPGVPLRGSPLEALFTLVSLHMKQADLLATQTLVRSSMAQGSETAKAAIEAYQAYCDAMFPFLEAAQDPNIDAKRQLLEHVKHPMQISTGELRKVLAQQAREKASAKFGAIRLGEKK